jgi:hypothetical protein
LAIDAGYFLLKPATRKDDFLTEYFAAVSIDGLRFPVMLEIACKEYSRIVTKQTNQNFLMLNRVLKQVLVRWEKSVPVNLYCDW